MKRVVLVAVLVLGLIFAVTSSAQEKISLQFWMSSYTPESTKFFNEIAVPDFEKEHPNVKVEYQGMGWGEQRAQKLAAAYSAGIAPDVFEGGSEHILEMVNKKELYGIDDYLKDYPELDDFFDAAFHTSRWEGHYYGLPIYTQVRTLNYRISHFEEVGLDPDAPPNNWAEQLEAAKKLTIQKGRRTMRAGYDVARLKGLAGVQEFMTFTWQAEGDYFDEDKNVIINSPEAAESLSYMVELYQAVYPVGTAPITAGTIPAFAADQVSMGTNGWFPFELMINKPDEMDDLGVALPIMKDEATGKRVASTYTNWLALSSQSKYPDEAWELIKFMASKEIVEEIAKSINSVPPRKSLMDGKYMTEDAPFMQKFAQIMGDYGRPNVIYPDFEVLNRILGDQIDLAIAGEKTPEAALDTVYEEWVKILPEEW